MGWSSVITVEPAMFLQQAGDTLTFVIYQNLFIDKICKVDLGYSNAVCDLYAQTTDLKPEEEILGPMMNNIQTSSSSFLLYNALVENSLPVLLVLFLGVWSDQTRKRKPPLLLCLTGKMLRSLGLLLNAYFISWPSFILLLTAALPHSLGGANAVFHMSAFSYIADASVPRSRTWRIGIAEAFWQLGTPVGLFLGAYLFKVGGYLCVFGTSFLFHLIGVLYTAFILPEVPQPNPQKHLVFGKYGNYGTYTETPVKRIRCYSENETANRDVEANNNKAKGTTTRTNNDLHSIKETEALLTVPNSSHPSPPNSKNDLVHPGSQEEISESPVSVYDFVIGSLRSIFKARPNHTRMCLLSLSSIMLLYGICYYGENNMKYLFTRTKFNWREQEFSTWTIVESGVVVVGLTVVMPIFSKLLKLSDPFAGALGALTRASSRLCYALGPNSSFLYIGAGIDVPGVIGPLSARSLASKCVLRDERGRIFAFLGCIEAVVPLLAVPLYSLIYSYTLAFLPSAIYFVSTGIDMVIFVIFGVLFIAMKMKIVQFTGTNVAALLGPSNVDEIPSVPISGIHFSCNLYRRSSLS